MRDVFWIIFYHQEDAEAQVYVEFSMLHNTSLVGLVGSHIRLRNLPRNRTLQLNHVGKGAGPSRKHLNLILSSPQISLNELRLSHMDSNNDLLVALKGLFKYFVHKFGSACLVYHISSPYIGRTHYT